MTLEEEIRLGLHGNHCKVIEDMLIDTVRETDKRVKNQMVSSMIENGKYSFDEIAAVLDMPIERVQEIYKIEKRN